MSNNKSTDITPSMRGDEQDLSAQTRQMAHPGSYDNFEYPSYDLDDDSSYPSEYVSNYVPNPELRRQAGLDEMPSSSQDYSANTAYGVTTSAQGAPVNEDASPSHTSAAYMPPSKSPAVAAYQSQQSAKKRKKASVAIIIFSLLLLALIAAGSFFAYRAHQHMQFSNAASDEISQAISALAKTDAYFVEVDEYLSGSINPEGLNVPRKALEDKDRVKKDLDSAKQLSDELSAKDKTYLSDEQVEVITALSESVSARQSMLDAALKIMNVDVEVSQARVHLNGAYTNIVEADTKVREALEKAKQYADQQKNKANEQLKAARSNKRQKESQSSSEEISAQSIVDLDQAALDALNNAKLELDKSKAASTSIDFTPIESYIEAKLAAVTLLKDIDTAVLENKVKEAVDKVKQYNEADAAVRPLAEALPTQPDELFKSYYQKETETQHKTYEEARKKAAEADGIIRKYQGIKTKDLASGAAVPAASASPAASAR